MEPIQDPNMPLSENQMTILSVEKCNWNMNLLADSQKMGHMFFPTAIHSTVQNQFKVSVNIDKISYCGLNFLRAIVSPSVLSIQGNVLLCGVHAPARAHTRHWFIVFVKLPSIYDWYCGLLLCRCNCSLLNPLVGVAPLVVVADVYPSEPDVILLDSAPSTEDVVPLLSGATGLGTLPLAIVICRRRDCEIS